LTVTSLTVQYLILPFSLPKAIKPYEVRMLWRDLRMTFPARAIFMEIYEASDAARGQWTPLCASRAEPLAVLVGIVIP
jgi:hypothetical protein